MEKLYIDPVEQVVLARSYDVERDWLLKAYTALGKREEPLAEDEGVRLGLRTVIKIAEAREKIRATPEPAEALASPLHSEARFQPINSGFNTRPPSVVETKAPSEILDNPLQREQDIIREVFNL